MIRKSAAISNPRPFGAAWMRDKKFLAGKALSGLGEANAVRFLDAYFNPFGIQAIAAKAIIDCFAAVISDHGCKG
jgi:hypothetical protein